jgi:hypothetical protein
VDKPYVSDYAAGKLYRVDKTVYTDNGANIAWEVDTRHFFKDYDRVTVDALVMDFETGVGNAVAPGDDPQVMLQVSRDGGRTWGAEMQAAARQDRRVHEARRGARLGTARDFVFKAAHHRSGEARARRPWHPRDAAGELMPINGGARRRRFDG